MSDTTPDERLWRLLNLRVDTALEAEQLRWEPWKVIIAAAAAGGGIVVANTALIGLILHLMGKIRCLAKPPIVRTSNRCRDRQGRGSMGSSHVTWDYIGIVHNAVVDDLSRARVMATLDYTARVA